jgi:hypothetical protein
MDRNVSTRTGESHAVRIVGNTKRHREGASSNWPAGAWSLARRVHYTGGSPGRTPASPIKAAGLARRARVPFWNIWLSMVNDIAAKLKMGLPDAYKCYGHWYCNINQMKSGSYGLPKIFIYAVDELPGQVR